MRVKFQLCVSFGDFNVKSPVLVGKNSISRYAVGVSSFSNFKFLFVSVSVNVTLFEMP